MDYDTQKIDRREAKLRKIREKILNAEAKMTEDALLSIPSGWFEFDTRVPPEEAKERMTLYVEKSVARAFKKHSNWQRRMRAVLWAFVEAEHEKLLMHSYGYEKAYFDKLDAARRKASEKELKVMK